MNLPDQEKGSFGIEVQQFTKVVLYEALRTSPLNIASAEPSITNSQQIIVDRKTNLRVARNNIIPLQSDNLSLVLQGLALKEALSHNLRRAAAILYCGDELSAEGAPDYFVPDEDKLAVFYFGFIQRGMQASQMARLLARRRKINESPYFKAEANFCVGQKNLIFNYIGPDPIQDLRNNYPKAFEGKQLEIS